MPRIVMRKYRLRSAPVRLAVGDIIRCPDFRSGLRWTADPSGEIIVAWQDQSYPAHHVKAGKGTLAHDAARAEASFLVVSIRLVESSGPDDVCPGNHRLSREVRCVRLAADMQFSEESERLRFDLDEPMSVARPGPRSVEVRGFAELPISWDEVEGEPADR